MKSTELKKLIAVGEGQNLEFKQTVTVGSGYKHIHDALKENGSPEVELDVNDHCFSVTFPRIQKQAMKKVGDRVGEKLTANQLRIVDEIKRDPSISARGLSLLLEISLRKTETNIRALREKNIVRRIGPARGGHWEIKK